MQEKKGYQPLVVPSLEVQTTEYVDLTGIDLTNPKTYLKDGLYSVIGTLPDPYPKAPFPNRRAHHLGNYWMVEGNYLMIKRVRERRPQVDVGHEDEVWLRAAERVLTQSEGKPNYNDYTGGTEEGAKNYINATAEFDQSLSRYPDDQLLCLSILPDSICFACQSTAEGMVGHHCHVLTAKDVEEVHRVIKRLDEVGVPNLYLPFLQTVEKITLGIVISKRNLFLQRG